MSEAPIYSSSQYILLSGQDYCSIIFQKSVISDNTMHQKYNNFFRTAGERLAETTKMAKS